MNMRSLIGDKPIIAIAFSWCVLLSGSLLCADENASSGTDVTRLRIATYNASLYGKSEGMVAEKLRSGKNQQAKQIAAIVQTVRPDILLVNEIDYDDDAATAKWLRDLYFAKQDESAQPPREPIDYPYVYSAASNTGIASGMDLDNDGATDGANDAWGYGVYPGQYAFSVFSRYPIQGDAIRTFQKFLWADLPGAIRPTMPGDGKSFHDDDVWRSLRLSSKNHVDVPITIDGRVVHVLASHPTPPVFDGPEDRNGARNHDEIDFWRHYIENDPAIKDDSGHAGGLGKGEAFVILGDLNSDPLSGDSRRGAIESLLEHPRITDPQPRRMSADDSTPDEVANDTANFGRNGEMRADYVLPSRELTTIDAQVFWPSDGQPGERWIHASDHRLVWVDVELPTK